MNEMLFGIELFMIKLGFPIASYVSGCLVLRILNMRWHK